VNAGPLLQAVAAILAGVRYMKNPKLKRQLVGLQLVSTWRAWTANPINSAGAFEIDIWLRPEAVRRRQRAIKSPDKL
jgi:hypothetical protein